MASKIFDNLKDYVVFDLETTGLSAEYDEIIEIGAIRVRNGEICDRYQTLVKPVNPIDGLITHITGITDEMVANERPIAAVLPEVLAFIGADVVVGHNVGFDIRFMEKSAERCGLTFTNEYVDTMRLSRKLVKELEHHRLSDLKEYYQIETAVSHRALADCEATKELYDILLDEASKLGKPLSDLFQRTHGAGKLKASDIVVSGNAVYNEDCPIFGKTVVFTGALERMVRKDAMQLVVNLGGVNGDNVTKNTNFLVLGNNDYCVALKDGKSSKHKKAEQLIEKGADLQILPEDVFFSMIEENEITL